MLRFLGYASLALVSVIGMIAAGIGAVLLSTPNPDDLNKCITAKMYNVPLCPSDKTYTKLSAISPYIRHAVIVSEDSAFFSHKGLDFVELKRSFELNMQKGRFARGGSTITQQLAKNVYLSAEKSLFRKAREALIATNIEKLYTKEQILEKYLNVVEFGPKIFGVRQATQFYFGKLPHEVNALEGAWLAFVLPNPEKYSTSFRKKELTKYARSQLRVIVQRMARFGKISKDDEAVALSQIDHMFKPVPDFAGEEDLDFDEEGGSETGLDADQTPAAEQPGDLETDSESDRGPDSVPEPVLEEIDVPDEPVEDTIDDESETVQ